MIDINLIRDPKTRKEVIESEKKRFRDGTSVEKAYELDRKRIETAFKLDQINARVNQLNREVKLGYKEGKKKEDEELAEKITEIKNLHDDAKRLKEEAGAAEEELNRVMKGIGNIISKEVVVSNDEKDNPIVRSYRSGRSIQKNPQPFSALMKDFTHSAAGAKVIGHRGYYLSGKMARLAQALTRYAIDFLENKGYTYIQTPVMLRRDVMAKTSQLSDFDEQLYKVEDDLYLIATSEQALAALYMDERMTPQEVPKKFCGQSLCFRKEAGAHGKDNAGLFRVHQFEKIEQFVICEPSESQRHHEEMIRICEEFYQSLDISYNVVSIVSGELNDAAAIKYDLEAYFPNAEKYRELVSCSNCTDYQSRELEIRYGIVKENNRKVYVHLLNGTMCAIQRALCCIVENYQRENGIDVPDVLQGYFGGDFIELSS
ncbi:seryl-tRNA synthetase [Encephalitozoon hellem]|uniref:serine--tRNA ligase n=1 Tax=Encephalitozoon hellem TaxID=27973 RepID=A0A9Q9C2L6_ENCHE|nr:seryl-tRNA synthetase [Encephalitozoon hellem ATCC 50504]AFM98117.1 seryl-tRNA synthetase [Encephalitozoon hellem ATCC 50504]KAG5859884.1 seryl-tRNA synthetase [Encephalitozoon hellem]UTX42961.1 seryl-tRNA synthetase [Encephalitozoon hellem]WEL38418.1 seryl-tRNA synthetase [Encephalitozoon hellem]|eukprot:XP_003887098.1 seryl-tRNA synthetase [Encephalitozoon hellem ATCC 50504]